jgi:hypothetical protein
MTTRLALLFDGIRALSPGNSLGKIRGTYPRVRPRAPKSCRIPFCSKHGLNHPVLKVRACDALSKSFVRDGNFILSEHLGVPNWSVGAT